MPLSKPQNEAVSFDAFSVLAVTDRESAMHGLQSALTAAGAAQAELTTIHPAQARDTLAQTPFSLAVLWDAPPACDALELMSQVRGAPVIIFQAQEDGARGTELLEAGAFDVVTPRQMESGQLPYVLRRLFGWLPRNGHRVEQEIERHIRTEAALRESNKRFRLALKNSPIAVWFQDTDLRYTWFYNPVPPFSSPDELIGKTDEEIFGPEAAEPIVELKRKALERGTKIQKEVQIEYKGRIAHHSLIVEPVREPGGEITGIRCAAVNVTGPRLTEEELQRAHTRLVTVNKRLRSEVHQRRRIAEVVRDQAELLDLAQDAILVCDSDDRVLYWNRGAEQLYGWSSAEAVGQITYELLNTRFPESFESLKEEIARTGSYACELEHLTKDGRRVTVESHWNIRADEEDETSLLQINRDITEQKRAEAEVRARDEELRLIMDAEPALISYVDDSYHYRRVNKTYQAWFGVKPEDVSGHHVRDILGEEAWREVEPYMTRALAGEIVSYEQLLPYAEGGARQVQVTYTPDRDAKGRVRGFVVLVSDVSTLKETQAALFESEERLRATFEHAGVGILEVDVNGEICEVNEYVCRLLGYSPDALKGITIHQLTWPADRRQSDELNQRVVRGDVDRLDYEKRYMRRDGTPIWVHITVAALRDPDGHVIRLIGTVEDIRERKEAQEKLQAANEELQAVNEELHATNEEIRDANERLAQEIHFRQQANRVLAEQAELLDLAHDAIIVRDLEDRITYWNSGAVETYGFSRSEAVGSYSPNLLKTEFGRPLEEIKRAVLRDGHFEGEFSQQKKDGTRIVVHSRWVLRREHGLPTSVLQINRDITERVRMEDALREAMLEAEHQRSQLEAVFQSVDDGIVVTDMFGNFLMVNEAEARTNGYPNADAMKKDLAYFATVYELFLPDGTPLPVAEWPVSKVLRGETIADWELRARRTDTGQEWFFSFGAEPVRDESGKQILAVVVTRDITERKKAEDALARHAELLRHANNDLEEMNAQLEEEIRDRRRAEEAVREATDSLTAAVDNARVGLWTLDLQSRKATFRGGWYSTLGYSSEELSETSDSWIKLIHPDDALRTLAHSQAWQDGRDAEREAELRVRGRGGEWRWVLSHARVTEWDSDHRPLQVQGVHTDITERKRTEEALHAREAELRAAKEEYQLLVENQTDMLARMSRDGRRLYVNPNFLRMVGKTETEVMGTDYHLEVHPGDMASVAERWAETFQPPHYRSDIEARTLTPRGWRWLSWRNKAILDENGEPSTAICVGRDVTRLKQAEEALVRSEAVLTQAGQMAHLGAWEIEVSDPENIDAGTLRWSDEVYRIFGYEPNSVEVSSDLFFRHVPPEDQPRVSETLAHAIRDRKPYTVEHRIMRKDGSERIVAEHAEIILDVHGRPERIIGAVQDITERKRIEDQIRRYTEELEQIVSERTVQIQKLERQRNESEKQVSVGRMAARIAHEINNPLAGVKNSFILIKKAVPTDYKHYEFVGRIDRELDRIARIVRQMFELYKPERKEPEAIKPADAIRDVVMLLLSNARAQEVTIEQQIEDVERRMVVHGDSLKQILFNILQNAIEASPPKGVITLEARVEDNILHMNITDQGEGIPEEVRSRIFEPFFTTKEDLASASLGLGLSVTRGLVESMGGSIWYDSEAGKGTTFHITMPVQIRPEEDDNTE